MLTKVRYIFRHVPLWASHTSFNLNFIDPFQLMGIVEFPKIVVLQSNDHYCRITFCRDICSRMRTAVSHCGLNPKIWWKRKQITSACATTTKSSKNIFYSVTDADSSKYLPCIFLLCKKWSLVNTDNRHFDFVLNSRGCLFQLLSNPK